MKYDTAPEFDADFKPLKEREQRLFMEHFSANSPRRA